MVELIRRVAELVVLSERMAGQILEGERGSSNNNNNSSSSRGGDDDKDDGEREEEDEKTNSSEDAMPYLALFDLFCERNALANIVNVVTGVAFAPKEEQQSRTNSSNSLDKAVQQLNPISSGAAATAAAAATTTTTHIPHILPPLTIATQAIQSVSILIQNVSRATSLYFLLSNNRVNDLIGLPIHLYKRAEMNHTHYLRFARRGSRRPTSYVGLPPPVLPTSQSLMNYASNEIGELTTHFVSFLKSLAMRVNAETLQFFLTYPIVHDSRTTATAQQQTEENAEEVDSNRPLVSGGDNESDVEEYTADEKETLSENDRADSTDDVDTMSTQLMSKLIRLESESDQSKSEDNSKSVKADAICPDNDASMTGAASNSADPTKERAMPLQPSKDNVTNQIPPQQEQPLEAEFPLYSRALEFCSSEQDSFVRVTAMNICMNMIRLATLQHDGDDVRDIMRTDSYQSKDEELRNQEATNYSAPLPTIAPSGILHEAPSLPLHDRIAIAKYACNPRRVSDLVSPLCARLTSQFGQVEGTVRTLQQLANASIPKHLQQSKAERKSRLVNTVHDLVANVQDELLMQSKCC
eukprot:scaffold18638_cov35-Cyclotella_meneghiniana.AAC.4